MQEETIQTEQFVSTIGDILIATAPALLTSVGGSPIAAIVTPAIWKLAKESYKFLKNYNYTPENEPLTKDKFHEAILKSSLNNGAENELLAIKANEIAIQNNPDKSTELQHEIDALQQSIKNTNLAIALGAVAITGSIAAWWFFSNKKQDYATAKNTPANKDETITQDHQDITQEALSIAGEDVKTADTDDN